MIPALLMSRSNPDGCSLLNRWAKARMLVRSARSRLATETVADVTEARMVRAAASPRSTDLTARVTSAPELARARAVQYPRPELAPVTITVRPFRRGMSATVQGMSPVWPAPYAWANRALRALVTTDFPVGVCLV